MHIGLALAAIAALAGAARITAQSPHTLPTALAAPGTPALTPRAGGVVFAEGVASDWQGNVYFNEMDNNNRTMQLRVGQDSGKVWRQAKDTPNGIWLDTQNRLVICQAKAIVRVKAGNTFDGMTDTLYKYPSTGENFNDVTGDSKDNLYFTNFNGSTVYFRDASTGASKTVLTGRPKPNGIEWDEERKIVYVCENGDGKVAAYDVGTDYSLTGRRDFATVAASDGIVLDAAGNVYVVAFGAGVHVFSPEGQKLGEIPITGTRLTNLAFGGADFNTLYLIGDKGLYKLPMQVKGYKTGNPTVSVIRPLRAVPDGIRFGIQAEYRMDGKRMREIPIKD